MQPPEPQTTSRSHLYSLENAKVDVAVTFKVGVDACTEDTLWVEWSLQTCHDSLIGQFLQGGLQPHLQLFGGREGSDKGSLKGSNGKSQIKNEKTDVKWKRPEMTDAFILFTATEAAQEHSKKRVQKAR